MGQILSQQELHDILKTERITDFLLRDDHILYIRKGQDYLYSQALFSMRVQPQDTERWLRQEFGKIKSLSSLAIDLMRDSSCIGNHGKHFAWHLLGAKQVHADSLPMHAREFALAGSYSDMHLYDRRAAHVACAWGMLFPLPYSLRIREKPKGSTLDYSLEREGCSRVRVRVVSPSQTQGVLPRKDKKTDRILYPNKQGETWWGTYAHNELRYAMEHGIEILTCDWSMSAMHSHRYLAPFCERVLELREHARNQDDIAGEILAKLLGNRLFGRLGMKQGEAILYKPAKDGLFFAGKHWGEKKSPVPMVNRLWGAMVFAEQRIALHRVLEQSTMPVYAHTDSVICRGFAGGTTGDDYGDWGLQDEGICNVRGMGQYDMRQRRAHRGEPNIVVRNPIGY